MAFANLTSGTVYLALGTALSSTGVLTEQTGAGYARIPVTAQFDTIADVVVFPQGVTFGATGVWAASSGMALFDSASGGNQLLAWSIPAFTLASGASYSVPANSFNVALNTAVLAPGKAVAGFSTVGTISSATGGSFGATVFSGAALTMTAAGVLSASASSYSPLSQSPVQFRNLIDGGDFSVNPFQRNIPGLASAGVISAAVSSTPTYFADRFFGVGGASSAILMATVANVTVPGFSVALQFGRQAANANTAAINLGQVIESADSIRMQGQPIALSFYAAAGASYSGGVVTATVFSGTGTNQSAAAMVAGTWAGQMTVATGTAALSTSMQRFQFNGTVPNGCTQLGVMFSYTPTGTAGAADNIQFMGIQLEQGSVASPFEHRDAQVELEICQRYAWMTPEPAAGVVVGTGMNTTSGAQLIYMATPVQLLKAPTVTVAAGTFKTNQAGTSTNTTITPASTHVVNAICINGSSAGTAGQATLLTGGGGSGFILASSDF